MLYTLYSILAKLVCILMAIVAVLIVVAPIYVLGKKSRKSSQTNRGGLPWL